MSEETLIPVTDERPDLEGRMMYCCEEYELFPSRWEAAFFQYRPGMEDDTFYCGHAGWD
jgi:hypothetical protein